MTDTARAVVEAAEAWADCPNVGNRINLECAVRAHRAAPKLVRCPLCDQPSPTKYEDCKYRKAHEKPTLSECRDYAPEPVEEDQTISTVLDRLSKMPQDDFDKALAEHRNGFYARLVDGGIVPEREVRRREREAFLQGWLWTDRINLDDDMGAEAEAAKRYPEPDAKPMVQCPHHADCPDKEKCGHSEPHKLRKFCAVRCDWQDRNDAACLPVAAPDPDPQHGPINVDAGPSLESRIAELERLVTYLPTYKEDLGNLARSVLALENRISAKDGGK